MTKLTNYLALTAFIFIAACNQPTNNNTQTKEETEHHDEHSESGDETIILNNGKKWSVDAPMMVSIRNMEKAVQNFSSTNPAAMMDDYKNLSKTLTQNVEDLTSSCTMTGQAHDELHKWLVPYIGLTEQMTEAKNPDEATTVLNELLTSLSEFNKYFE